MHCNKIIGIVLFLLIIPHIAFAGQLFEELSLENNKIVSLANPVNNQDAATKLYVDGGGGGGSNIDSIVTASGEVVVASGNVVHTTGSP